MQKLLPHLCAMLLLLFVLPACKDDNDHDHDGDTNAPVLIIEEPAADETISGEVHIHGSLTDESLHEMEIKVTVDADSSELFKIVPTVHDLTEYHFDEHFTPSVAAETAVTLTITVADHSDNVTMQSVRFKVKP